MENRWICFKEVEATTVTEDYKQYDNAFTVKIPQGCP